MKNRCGCGSVGRAVISDTIGSNPVMCKNYIEHSLTVNCIKKMKIKREAVNGPIKNRNNEAEKRFRERANGRVKESLKEEKERY